MFNWESLWAVGYSYFYFLEKHLFCCYSNSRVFLCYSDVFDPTGLILVLEHSTALGIFPSHICVLTCTVLHCVILFWEVKSSNWCEGFVRWLSQPNGSLLYETPFHFCPCTRPGLQRTPLEAGSASQIGRKPFYFFSLGLILRWFSIKNQLAQGSDECQSWYK